MNSYLVHKVCGGAIYLDVTSNLRFVSTFGIRWDSLQVGLGKTLNQQEKIETDFYCVECKKIVEAKDILGICFHCAGSFEPKELYTLQESGGLYCNEHSQREDEKRKSLITIMKKVSF